MATPMYLVLADIFAAPEMIKTGSIIRTNAAPGDHLKPLNAEAEARMEEWYQEVVEYTETTFDDTTGAPIQKLRKIQPHLRFKLAAETGGKPVHAIETVKLPTKDQPGGMSLAETLIRHTSTDQRPGPAVPLVPDLSDIEDEPLGNEVEAVTSVPDPKAKMRIS
jgi:hypothetical protein